MGQWTVLPAPCVQGRRGEQPMREVVNRQEVQVGVTRDRLSPGVGVWETRTVMDLLRAVLDMPQIRAENPSSWEVRAAIHPRASTLGGRRL